jgi:hypothetical protein
MPRGTARAVANAVRAVTTVGVVRPLRILLSATPLAKAKTPIAKEIAPVTNASSTSSMSLNVEQTGAERTRSGVGRQRR